MRLPIVIILVLSISALLVLVAFRPSIINVECATMVSVGGTQCIEVGVRGPLKPTVLVCSPNGSCKEYVGDRIVFRVTEEGNYSVCVRVGLPGLWGEERRFTFSASDAPVVRLDAPSVVPLGERALVRIKATDSSGIARLTATVNGSRVEVKKSDDVWTLEIVPRELGTVLVEVSAVDPYGNEGRGEAVIAVEPPPFLVQAARSLSEREANALYELYAALPSLLKEALLERPAVVGLALRYYCLGVLDSEEFAALIDSRVAKVAVLLEVERGEEGWAEAVERIAAELSRRGIAPAIAYPPRLPLPDAVARTCEAVYYPYSGSSLLRVPPDLVEVEVAATARRLRSTGARVVDRVLVLPWGEYGPHVTNASVLQGWLLISPGADDAGLYLFGNTTVLEVPRFPQVGCVNDLCLIDAFVEELTNGTLLRALLSLADEVGNGTLGGRKAVAVPLSILTELARLEDKEEVRSRRVERLLLVPGSEDRWRAYYRLMGEAAALLKRVQTREQWYEKVCGALDTAAFWVTSAPRGSRLKEYWDRQAEALLRLGLAVHDLKVATLAVSRWVYQLQNTDLEELKALPVDLIVVDPDDSGFSPDDLTELKATGKIVLAYVDIGEAEDYRDYWRPEWWRNPPEWLGEENPDWEGCYFVKYWYREWQNIVYERLRRVVNLGYDGVYLDGIDVYEYWEERGHPDAEELMVSLVVNISRFVKNLKSDFLVFPQNGLELLRRSEYLDAIDGVGKEDTWFLLDERRSKAEIRHDLELLRLARSSGKLVLVIDYPRRLEHIREFFENALAEGFVPYVGPLELDKVGYYECPGGE